MTEKTEKTKSAHWPRVLHPRVAKERHPKLWERAKSLLPYTLTEEDVARIVSLVVDTCVCCFQRNAACRCWDGLRGRQ